MKSHCSQRRTVRTVPKLPALIIISLLATLVLYGCGGGSDTGSSDTGSQEATGDEQGTRSAEGAEESTGGGDTAGPDALGGGTTGGSTTGGGAAGGSDQDGRDKPRAVRGLYVPGNVASGQRLDGLLVFRHD